MATRRHPIVDGAWFDLANAIPTGQEGINAQLKTWGNWSRRHKRVGHAESLEGYYRPPRGQEVEYLDGDAVLPIQTATPVTQEDSQTALAVERAVVQLPDKERRALRLRYIAQADHAFCARRLHLPFASWPEFLRRARQMVSNIMSLTLKLSGRTIGRDNSDTAA